MNENNNLEIRHALSLKFVDQQAIDNSTSDILKVEAALPGQLQDIVKVWLANQQEKRMVNAVNSVLNPDRNPMTVDDLPVLVEVLTAAFNTCITQNTSDQYDQSIDLSAAGLKQALFTLLKHRRQAPSFDEIIEDLERFNFQAKSEHHRESVRTMLRYYSDKKKFLKIDANEKWALTGAGEKIFSAEFENLMKATTDKGATQTTVAIAPAAEMRDGTGTFSSKFDTGGIPLAKHYADIIGEGGAEKMHAAEIAEVFNKKHNQNAIAHDVGSTLRKNSHTRTPLVIALGDNFFGLTNQSAK